jgi:class 3 adenylate cyclase/pimeloyl-ACP methyl ester carboxylesterase
VDVPDVSYARSGDVSIAYQEVGTGSSDLVFLPFLSNLFTLWYQPRFSEFCARLAEGRRVTLINPRGVGLSDRPRGYTIESRVDDVRAVMDSARIERSPVLAIGESAATCALFAASYPDRVERLILYMPYARASPEERRAALTQAGIEEERSTFEGREMLEELARDLNPQWADDPQYLYWFVWHHRLTSSPSSWLTFTRMAVDLDVTDVLPAVRVPTLVVTKERRREAALEVAEAIPDCEFLVVPGQGLAIMENDFVFEAIDAFLEGAPRKQIPDSVLVTVLFTDLVGSTERAAALGDRAWRELLSGHHEIVRRELARFRGVEIDTAGDGFFATFDGPARAIRAAQSIVAGVGELGLGIRAGVHTGECEVHEGKVAGIAVSMGARVSAAAGLGEVLVSSTVKDLVAGSEIEFEDRGAHELKGVPGEWRLFAVSPS